jgi:hypothetical protein
MWDRCLEVHSYVMLPSPINKIYVEPLLQHKALK